MPIPIEQEQETLSSLAGIHMLDGVYWTAGGGGRKGLGRRDRVQLSGFSLEGNLRGIGDCTGGWTAVVPQEPGEYSLRWGG